MKVKGERKAQVESAMNGSERYNESESQSQSESYLRKNLKK